MCEDALDDWCDITALEFEKWGPAFRNRLDGEPAACKRLLARAEFDQPSKWKRNRILQENIETTLCERSSNSLPISTSENHEEESRKFRLDEMKDQIPNQHKKAWRIMDGLAATVRSQPPKLK